MLEEGTFLFSDLRRRVDGVSERIAHTLQHLEADRMIIRVAPAVVPPHVHHSLSPMGREAAGHVRRLADWVETRVPTILAEP